IVVELDLAGILRIVATGSSLHDSTCVRHGASFAAHADGGLSRLPRWWRGFVLPECDRAKSGYEQRRNQRPQQRAFQPGASAPGRTTARADSDRLITACHEGDSIRGTKLRALSESRLTNVSKAQTT